MIRILQETLMKRMSIFLLYVLAAQTLFCSHSDRKSIHTRQGLLALAAFQSAAVNTVCTGTRYDDSPKMFNLSIDHEAWNGIANSTAGAFLFNSSAPKNLFEVYGASISGANGTSTNASYTWTTKKSAKVYSPIKGYVSRLELQSNEWWSQDYEIELKTNANSVYVFILDHFNSPLVSKGSLVTVGQELGTTGNLISGSASNPVMNTVYSAYELQVSKYSVGSNCTDQSTTGLKSVCPTSLLDSSVSDSMKSKLLKLMSDWETLKGNSAIYNENTMIIPGCYSESF